MTHLKAIVFSVAILTAACSSGAMSDSPPYVEPECTAADAKKTVLPPSVTTYCTRCDEGHCDDKGDACDRYGARCDYFGTDGVCVACCNGEVGELHCSPINH